MIFRKMQVFFQMRKFLAGVEFWKSAFYIDLWNVFVEEVRFCYNMDEIRKIGQIIRYMVRVFSLWSGKIEEEYGLWERQYPAGRHLSAAAAAV